METTLIKLFVVLLFGVLVGGGVYLVLAIMEWRQHRAERLAAMRTEALMGSEEGGRKA